MAVPSASYSVTLRVEYPNRAGSLGKIFSTIGEAESDVGAVDIVRQGERSVRDITVNARDSEHAHQIADAIDALPEVRVLSFSDRTFLTHLGGKIEVKPKMSLNMRDALSMAYTPGVARVCQAVADDPKQVFNLTVKRNTIAVVSDGTAVLGLGDVGPEAAMPVMEGKAMLFKEFADVDAYPICLDTTDTEEIIATVKNIAPGFGGINLEDIAAPRCFEIEERLQEELDIPVFHDDQHGTAVVVLAALINSLKIVGKEMKLAAARALSEVIPEEDLSEDYIIPSLFDERIVPMMAEAVEEAAHDSGVARPPLEEDIVEAPPQQC
jgi:malate dehydrogenase (oxaloacetate-decarboxylating)